jgi:hypothetical protein
MLWLDTANDTPALEASGGSYVSKVRTYDFNDSKQACLERQGEAMGWRAGLLVGGLAAERLQLPATNSSTSTTTIS